MTDTTWEKEVGKLLRDGEKARDALFAALEAETTKRVECECGRKFNTTVRDTTNAVRAAEIWFRQGAELAKHLERLHERIPTTDDDRPYADWTTEQLQAKLREHQLRAGMRADRPGTRPATPPEGRSRTRTCRSAG